MTVEKVYQVIFIDVVNTSIEHAGSHVYWIGSGPVGITEDHRRSAHQRANQSSI